MTSDRLCLMPVISLNHIFDVSGFPTTLQPFDCETVVLLSLPPLLLLLLLPLLSSSLLLLLSLLSIILLFFFFFVFLSFLPVFLFFFFFFFSFFSSHPLFWSCFASQDTKSQFSTTKQTKFRLLRRGQTNIHFPSVRKKKKLFSFRSFFFFFSFFVVIIKSNGYDSFLPVPKPKSHSFHNSNQRNQPLLIRLGDPVGLKSDSK